MLYYPYPMDQPTTIAAQILIDKGNSDAEVARLFGVAEEEVAALPHPPVPTKRRTAKEEARQYIMDMSPAEKRQFFKEIDPYKLWTMAEGAPETKVDISQEPVRIDITHQLLKVYGGSPTELPEHREAIELPPGASQ